MIRLIITAYNIAWLIYNIHKFGAKFFIFLTNWTFIILNIYFVCATTLSCIALYKDVRNDMQTTPQATGDEVVQMEMGPVDGNGYGTIEPEISREKDDLRFHHKFLWFLYGISATAGVWITVGYWTILVGDDPIDANNITKHALNTVFMVIDTWLSAVPIRLFHSLYPFLYLVIYLIFTVIYWLLGGTNRHGEPFIYEALNYNDFDPTLGSLLVVFIVVVLPILHLILFGVTKLRDHLYRKYKEA